ncbi:MAG: class I SAM-dependent methyltransferase [Chitinophagaceae bacterium]|nr:class I SAM-dependent methyltransferase [Chitinophagaceae bacterium]
MALKQHTDISEMIRQQRENAAMYVLPFVEQTLPIKSGIKVLEIGCGEGGVLKPFYDKGCLSVGVDLDGVRIDRAQDVFATEIATGNMRITLENVYDDAFKTKYKNFFDLIILKDVIEHIPQQENFIPYLKTLLVPRGKVFFGFPPWYMPFGGHQQILISGWASKLPYYHLLPNFLYTGIMKMAGETKEKIDEMLEIKSTGINIERFEKIVNSSGFKIVSKQWFLINPIYKYKFGLNPKKQNWLFGAVPYLRNFLTTCAYYIIEME